MNKTTDPVTTVPVTAPTLGRRAYDAPVALVVGMWLTVCVSTVLAIWAGSRRWLRSDEPVMEWMVLEEIPRAGRKARSVSDTENKQAEIPSLLVHDFDALAELGPQLNRPDFAHSRGAEEVQPAESAIPIAKRWRFLFDAGLTEGQYARQLAALEVEVAVLQDDGSLDYVSQPGEAGASRRHGIQADEQRPYWTWSRGDLQRADEVLLRHAEVPAEDRIVLHFISAASIEQLEKLERDHQGRPPEAILLTVFALKRTFRGYEPYVAEQTIR